MATCAGCGQTILFGGETLGDRRFCNERCVAAATSAAQLPHVSSSQMSSRAWEIYLGRCPLCHGIGPVEVHTSHRVYSALLITSRSARSLVSCRACATKAQLKDTAFSLLLGWWGLPWGIVFTPIQVARNLASLLRTERSTSPSADLLAHAALQLASEMTRPQHGANVRRTA